MKVLTRSEIDGMECSATFDDTEEYRYDLCWRWRTGRLLVGWLLNPSTATHEVLDPTVKGMIKRARAWGYAGVQIINLFGLRATDPSLMKRHANPVGDDNDLVIRRALIQAAEHASMVVAGWGTDGRHMNRQSRALQLAQIAGVQLHAFQINKGGTPKHPLYVAHTRTPISWSGTDGR